MIAKGSSEPRVVGTDQGLGQALELGPGYKCKTSG